MEQDVKSKMGAYALLFFTLEGSTDAYVAHSVLESIPMPFTERFRVNVAMDGYPASEVLLDRRIAGIRWDYVGEPKESSAVKP